MIIIRGDILLVDLDPKKGSEMGKVRPCVVVQNNIGNKYSPTIVVVIITSQIPLKIYPVDVFIQKESSGLDKDSLIVGSQIYTIDVAERVIKKIGQLDAKVMQKVTLALKYNLQIN